MYIRILSMRKHKTISFLTTYSKEYGVSQFMIDNSLIKEIKCGDLLNIEFLDTFNHKNMPIKQVIKINFIVPCQDFNSGKGVVKEKLDTKTQNLIDARNGGYPIQLLNFKRQILNKLKEILNDLNYLDATNLTNTVEIRSSGSEIREAQLLDKDSNQPKFLRITLENQLRQLSAITLNSVYAIEKVFRNMGEDKNHINEFLMLEMISLFQSMPDILNFINHIDEMAKEIAENNKIKVIDKDIEIIDYNDVKKRNGDYNTLRKSFMNTLVINFPCESPFIKKDERSGIRTETRWYMNGHWISHFYEDETDYDIVSEVLKTQKANHNEKDINMLEFYEWGLPNSISFGLSIDRWLQMLCNLENINSIANPISLDYVRRRKL